MMAPRLPSTHVNLTALFLLAFALRLATAVSLGLDKAPVSDQVEFDTYAWNLSQGRGYRGMSPDVTDQDHLTAYRSPCVSVVWAGMYRLVGRRYDVLRVFHCALGAVATVLVYAIGKRCFDRRVGWLAAALFAIYPVGLLMATALEAEPLLTVWFLWFILACLQFAERPIWGRAALAGLLLGCNLLTHPTKVVMLPLVCGWALWQFRRQPRSLAMGLAIPVLGVACLTPWVVRNQRVFGKFIPFSTQGGSALLQGNNDVVVTDPKYFGYSIWDTKISPEIAAALRAPNNEIERDAVAMRLATDWLKANVDKWPFLAQAKLRRAFTPFLQPQTRPLYRWGMLLSWGPIWLLCLIALLPTFVVFLRRQHPGWLLHLGIAHYALNAVVFYGLWRYRFPVEGLCIILASAAVVWFWQRFRKSA